MLTNDFDPGDFPAGESSVFLEQRCIHDDLKPGYMQHNDASYRKQRHSSSSEMARGAFGRTHNMREGMKLGNSVLTGR